MAQLIHTFPAWSVVVGLVVLVLAGGLFLAADFLILPFFPAASWKRPWCWLSDHASDERDAGDDDQDGLTRGSDVMVWPDGHVGGGTHTQNGGYGSLQRHVGAARAGRELDGVVHDARPEVSA